MSNFVSGNGVLSYLEKNKENSKFTLVDGSFKNVKLESILYASSTLIKWNDKMLKIKTINSSLRKSFIRKIASRSTPHGGEFCPQVIKEILVSSDQLRINVEANADGRWTHGYVYEMQCG